MKNTITILLLLCALSGLGQNRAQYIHKKVKTSIITVKSETYPGDYFLTVNVFHKELDKVDWMNSTAIVEFKFLGNDGHTLFVKRVENDDILHKVEVDELRFKIEPGKPTEITLIAQDSQKEPFPIRLQVEVSNNSIKAKLLSDLPQYVEN